MSEYSATVEAMRRRCKVVASTNDWLGLPLLIFKVGGREEPAILITAGASGIEAATVYAALELLVQVDVERTTYILPSRDPTGLHDASFILSKMLGADVKVESVEDVAKVMKGGGAEIVVDDRELFLALIKGVGVAVGKGLNAFETVRLMRRRLKDFALLDSLEGSRILVASQLPEVEGVGELGRFMTVVVEGGDVLMYDDVGRVNVPEVAFLRDFLEKQELGLVIDLHETRSPAFFAMTSDAPSSTESTILYLVLDQVRSRGGRIATPQQLEELGLDAAVDGVGYGRGICGLIDFVSPKSYAIALAAPLSAPLDERAGTLVVATLSALNAFIVVPS